MNKIKSATMTLAKAADGNPVIATMTVILFYVAFCRVEAYIESLIFGARFEHWLDPIFASTFIAYAAYAVYYCALHNDQKRLSRNEAEVAGD